jgi:hypothetical protein
LVLGNYTIKNYVIGDSYFCTFKNEHVKLVNIAHSKDDPAKVILIGRQFEKQEDFFSIPIKSSCLDIYFVKQLSNTLKYWNITDVKKKKL